VRGHLGKIVSPSIKLEILENLFSLLFVEFLDGRHRSDEAEQAEDSIIAALPHQVTLCVVFSLPLISNR
jgi:hypothetical protein